MLTKDQYESALRMAQSYMSVDPTPDSRYGQRLWELLTLIREYERAQKHTHADVQARIDRKLGKV